MREKHEMMKMIHALDFAIHELVLFLDTHPTNQRAMQLLREYRNERKETVELYEQKYGTYIVTPADAPANSSCWQWLESPWPWENEEV